MIWNPEEDIVASQPDLIRGNWIRTTALGPFRI